MRISITVWFLFVLISPGLSVQAVTQYEAPDLGEYELTTLDNGFRVLLKSRGPSQTASLRLYVKVGMNDFSCEKAEIPHYLEHLLFDGTKNFTREAIKARFDEHGIYYNATTSAEDTTYELEVYSPHMSVAIETLYDMIAHSTLPKARVEQTRKIIHQELGGEPSWLTQKLASMGLRRSAVREAMTLILPKSFTRCHMAAHANGITREELLAAYQKYYVPQNMTLVMVGQFSSEKVKQQLKRTFGSLLKTDYQHAFHEFRFLDGDDPEFTGRLDPIMSEQTLVGYAYAMPGLNDPDFIPLMFLEDYLYERLYKVLRMEAGISYAPLSELYNMQRHSMFLVGSDVEHADVDKAKSLILAEIENIKTGNIDHMFFEKTKKSLLLSMVHDYESNAAYASTYTGSLTEIDAFGKILSNEKVYKQITTKQLTRLANRYLIPSNRIRILGDPTFTPLQLTVIVFVLLGIMGYLVFSLIVGLRKKRKEKGALL